MIYQKMSSNKAMGPDELAVFETMYEQDRCSAVAEEKFDGSRFGVWKDQEGEFQFFSTQGKDRTINVPYLVEKLKKLNIPERTMLDCEVVHLFEPRAKRWELSRSVMGTNDFNPDVPEANLLIFDVMMVNGVDLTKNYDFIDRRAIIEEIFSGKGMIEEHTFRHWEGIAYPELFTANVFQALFLQILSEGGEGIMIKNIYEKRYAKDWIKVKNKMTFDAVVMQIHKGTGKNKERVGALELGMYDGDKLVSIGKCSGIEDKLRDEFMVNTPEVIEVECFEVTKGLKLRHPSFKRVREDKSKYECKLEQLKEVLENVKG